MQSPDGEDCIGVFSSSRNTRDFSCGICAQKREIRFIAQDSQVSLEYRRAAVRYLSPDGERRPARGKRRQYELHSSSYCLLCPVLRLSGAERGRRRFAGGPAGDQFGIIFHTDDHIAVSTGFPADIFAVNHLDSHMSFLQREVFHGRQ